MIGSALESWLWRRLRCPSRRPVPWVKGVKQWCRCERWRGHSGDHRGTAWAPADLYSFAVRRKEPLTWWDR